MTSHLQAACCCALLTGCSTRRVKQARFPPLRSSQTAARPAITTLTAPLRGSGASMLSWSIYLLNLLHPHRKQYIHPCCCFSPSRSHWKRQAAQGRGRERKQMDLLNVSQHWSTDAQRHVKISWTTLHDVKVHTQGAIAWLLWGSCYEECSCSRQGEVQLIAGAPQLSSVLQMGLPPSLTCCVRLKGFPPQEKESKL